ncbi:hypothetical protein AAC387_Pa05g1590 [Persea americana]
MLGESTLPHEVLSSDGIKHPLQIKVAMKILPEKSVILLQKEYQQDTIMDQMPNCITTSPHLSPDCKSIDFSSTREDFNANWSYPYNMERERVEDEDREFLRNFFDTIDFRAQILLEC